MTIFRFRLTRRLTSLSDTRSGGATNIAIGFFLLLMCFANLVWNQNLPSTFAFRNIFLYFPAVGDEATFSEETQEYYYNSSNLPQRIFTCGYDNTQLFLEMVPELKDVTRIPLTRVTANLSQDNDLVVIGVGGFCDGWGAQKLGSIWISENFRGRAFHINGESFGGEPWEVATTNDGHTTPPPRGYHLGYVSDSKQSVKCYFVAMVLATKKMFWGMIFDHALKPIGTKEHFLIYTASNCVDFREDAFDSFAKLGMVHYGGKCMGNVNMASNKSRSPLAAGGNAAWQGNWQRFKPYRFCMVLENTKKAGYITEKILNSFLAGCIPIYYGTKEVFDIFNKDAFVYYDIETPALALARIAELEADSAEYNKMASAPILVNGYATMEKYFSLVDGIGAATLKKRIRTMIGFPNPPPPNISVPW